MSTEPRIKRLLGKDGKCFDVAMDHSIFNEWDFLSGIENMSEAIQAIVHANPDAIQLSPGMALHLQHLPGKEKPSLVLRVDVANVYDRKDSKYLQCCGHDHPDKPSTAGFGDDSGCDFHILSDHADFDSGFGSF